MPTIQTKAKGSFDLKSNDGPEAKRDRCWMYGRKLQ